MRFRTYLLMMAAILSLIGIRTMNGDDLLTVSSVAAAPSASVSREEIPEEAIRLRILANSDHPRDQWLKRRVRNAVLEEIGGWVHQPKNIGEARRLIRKNLPRFQEIADETVRKHGFDYDVKVDYGFVPFPTKLYGNQVYPAGEYEALRIVIGKGEGDNWWCVLFPPLCFVDMESGDALPAEETGRMTASAVSDVFASRGHGERSGESPVEVRFFLLDVLEEIFSELLE